MVVPEGPDGLKTPEGGSNSRCARIYLARHGETAWSVSAQPRLNQILPEARGIVEKALIPVKELA